MRTQTASSPAPSLDSKTIQNLLAQYGCGSIQLSGTANAFYERHVVFDNVVAPDAAGARERFEAVARSVRDILSQRWVLTEATYERENPKRVYYMSMEFLIGRALSNNAMNLLLGPAISQAVREKNLDLLEILSQEPDAGLGNGGLGRLAGPRASSNQWLHCNFPAWATDCGMNTACSSRPPATVGSTSSRTTGCAG